MPFHGEVVLRELNAVDFEVVEPLQYEGRSQTFTVEPGFKTDLASVPRALVWLFPRYGTYTKTAVVHDFLWRTNAVPRHDADGLFRRALREQGVSIPRRWTMWAAVRAGSFMSGATALEWLQFLLVAMVMIPFVALPAVIVQVWLLVWWVVEAGFWLGGRLVRRPVNRPTHPFRA